MMNKKCITQPFINHAVLDRAYFRVMLIIESMLIFARLRYITSNNLDLWYFTNFLFFRCLFLGTKRCDGTISESARSIPLNTPLRQRMELLAKAAEQEKNS